MTSLYRMRLILLAGVVICTGMPDRHASIARADSPNQVQENDSPEGDGGSQKVSTRKQTELLRWRQTFFWGIVLLIVFMISAGVIIRFSIRYRRYLLSGKKEKPTPTEDVWKMHKLPDGALDKIGDEDRPEN